MNDALSIQDLRVTFATPEGPLPAVRGVSLRLRRGEALAIVGESGAGKSQLFQAALGLLAPNAETSGRVEFGGVDLLSCGRGALNRVRGERIGVVFQDPMTALNPYLTVGRQLTEVLQVHRGLKRAAARARALAMLSAVRVPDPARRLDQYPHELSGGLRQRVMIAMALICDPEVLVADEPTTALDVTVQAEIMALLDGIRCERGTALALITHDLGVVGDHCEWIAVMYAGILVETGPTAEVLGMPAHPYTRGLLAATPALAKPQGGRMPTIPGQPPDPRALPRGCPFRPRCAVAVAACGEREPALVEWGGGRAAACWVATGHP